MNKKNNIIMATINIIINKTLKKVGHIDSSIYQTLSWGEYKILNNGLTIRLGVVEEATIVKYLLKRMTYDNQIKIFIIEDPKIIDKINYENNKRIAKL